MACPCFGSSYLGGGVALSAVLSPAFSPSVTRSLGPCSAPGIPGLSALVCVAAGDSARTEDVFLEVWYTWTWALRAPCKRAGLWLQESLWIQWNCRTVCQWGQQGAGQGSLHRRWMLCYIVVYTRLSCPSLSRVGKQRHSAGSGVLLLLLHWASRWFPLLLDIIAGFPLSSGIHLRRGRGP